MASRACVEKAGLAIPAFDFSGLKTLDLHGGLALLALHLRGPWTCLWGLVPRGKDFVGYILVSGEHLYGIRMGTEKSRRWHVRLDL